MKGDSSGGLTRCADGQVAGLSSLSLSYRSNKLYFESQLYNDEKDTAQFLNVPPNDKFPYQKDLYTY